VWMQSHDLVLDNRGICARMHEGSITYFLFISFIEVGGTA